jgi:hypothetical protein
VTGSLTKPLEDPNALFRFHEDEKEGPLLNCRSIWFQVGFDWIGLVCIRLAELPLDLVPGSIRLDWISLD